MRAANYAQREGTHISIPEQCPFTNVSYARGCSIPTSRRKRVTGIIDVIFMRAAWSSWECVALGSPLITIFLAAEIEVIGQTYMASPVSLF